MKTILQLVKKDYKLFLKDKVALSLTFIIPMVLIALFGAVFGGAGDFEKLSLGFVNQSSSKVAKTIETTLDTTKTFRLIKSYKNEKGETVLYDSNTIKTAVMSGKFSAAIVLPEDAFTDTSSSLKMKFYYDPKNDMESQVIQGVLQQTIMQSIPEVFTQSMQKKSESFLGKDTGKMFNSEMNKTISKYFKVDTSEIYGNMNKGTTKKSTDTTKSKKGGFNMFDNMLNLEKYQLVGKQVTNPMATRSVGGWAMMFLLFSLAGASRSLFEEKQSGVMIRLLSSPVTRTQILWSKYIYNMTVGIIQLVVLFLGGMFLFKIDIFSNFLNLMLLITASSIACTAFGMFLASFTKTSAQANGLGTLLILTMSAVGGSWFPVSMMPETIQFFSKFTITYWSIEGFLAVLWRGSGFMEILPFLGILLGIGIVVNIVSYFNFKRGNIFRN
ncbi:MAG: ABC transporter permease [Ignavibacteriae bacterium]|nr:ABC transporter permease [Ignavibacteriota bacterium]